MSKEIKIAFIAEGGNASLGKALEMLSGTLNTVCPKGRIVLVTDEDDKLDIDPVKWKIVGYPEQERGYGMFIPPVGHVDQFGYKVGIDSARDGKDYSVLISAFVQHKQNGREFDHIIIDTIDYVKPSKDECDLLIGESSNHRRKHIAMCGFNFGIISSMKPSGEGSIEEKLSYPEFDMPISDYAFHYDTEPKRFHQVSFNRSVKFPKKHKYKTNKRHEKRQFGGRRQRRNW